MKVLNRIDASLNLPEEERLLLDAVRALSRDHLKPRAAAYDLSGEFPWDNVEEITKLGLNGMFLPDEYGGSKMSYVSYLAAMREMAKACASTAMVWGNTFHAVKPFLNFASHEQKTRLLPRIVDGGMVSLCITEPSAGSDATSMKTKFTPDGDDIIINGSKIFITCGNHAEFYGVFGKWSEIENDRAAISIAIVEKGAEGLTIGGKEDKMGQRAAPIVPLSFDNLRVPRTNLLGEPGDGLKILFSALNESAPPLRPMLWALRVPPLKTRWAILINGGSRAAISLNSRAYSSCSPIWRRIWPCAKAGCGASAPCLMRARRISVSKPRC